MDKKTVTLIAAIAAILIGAFFIVRATSAGGPAGANASADRSDMIKFVAGMPVEQLKEMRSNWAAQLEVYKSTPGVKPKVISDTERNLADLDKILAEKGVTP